MQIVTVDASSSYDIIIGENILHLLGSYTRQVISPCKVCLVSDDIVDRLYGKVAEEALACEGFEVIKFVIKHGEASKSTHSLVALCEFLAENRLTRSDALVALGGGVVGDLTGFAASVYLRGLRFVQVPTTLLSAVDSSVGGKTAVDLAAGKNLMGSFYQPSLVLCDYSTLRTLPDEIFAQGCAEVIKYAVINDAPFFDSLFGGIENNIEDVIANCVKKKAEIVKQDEFDNGVRRLLNLGHTVGHAVELCSQLTISHGDAVAIGMMIVTSAATKMGLCPPSALARLKELLIRHGLPTACDFSASELAAVASADKKRSADTIALVVPYDIGQTRILEIPVDKLCEFIERGL